MITEHVNWTTITPKMLSDPAARRLIRACARQLELCDKNEVSGSMILQIRNQAAEHATKLTAVIAPVVVLCVYVLCDLRAQGWRFRVSPQKIEIAPPDDVGTAEERKAQIR